MPRRAERTRPPRVDEHAAPSRPAADRSGAAHVGYGPPPAVPPGDRDGVHRPPGRRTRRRRRVAADATAPRSCPRGRWRRPPLSSPTPPPPAAATGTTLTTDTPATSGDAATTDASATTTADGGTDTTDVRGPTLSEPPIAAADLPALLPDADLAVLPAGAGVVQILDPCADGGDGCPAGLETTILAGGIEPLSIVEATTAVTPDASPSTTSAYAVARSMPVRPSSQSSATTRPASPSAATGRATPPPRNACASATPPTGTEAMSTTSSRAPC